MQRVHIVVDFMYIYYKYKFTLMAGRLKDLTTEIDGEVKDVSMLYYCIKEIESFKKMWCKAEECVAVTICFDSKSQRVESDCSYKSKRTGGLDSTDFYSIKEIYGTLEKAGYTCIKIPGMEADDIVYAVVNKAKDDFDKTIIFTPDKDLLVNIGDDDKVAVSRYKQTKGYTYIDRNNVSKVMTNEFKTYIPYGGLILYLCTVRDKSDNIVGIKGFGNAAYSKLLGGCYTLVKDIGLFNNYDATEELIKRSAGLSESQKEQALHSLKLVKPVECDISYVENYGTSTKESRTAAYSKYGFQSLI